MKISKVLGVVPILLVFGCVSAGGVSSSSKPSEGGFYGTYLFVNPCQNKIMAAKDVKGFGSDLASALVAGAVKTGIDWVGSAIAKAAADDIEKTTVSANLMSLSHLTDSSVDICIQIVRGSFKYSENDKHIFANRFAIDPNTKEVAPLELVSGTEELFVELLPMSHERVISFIPLEIRYSGFTSKDRKSKKPRNLAMFIGYSLENQDVSAGEYSGRLINFGTLHPKSNGIATAKYISDDGRLSLVKQTQWLGLPEGANTKPVTIAANIIETRKAGRLSKFLAEVFESSKEDIQKSAESAVSELDILKTTKEIEKEKLASEKERIENELAFLDGKADVMVKEESLNTLCSSNSPEKSKVFDAQKQLYFAKKNTNILAVFANKTRPYTNADILQPTGDCD